MIPTAPTAYKREGSLSGDTHKGGINVKNMAHIFDLLTHIYGDSKDCLREYACNAWDAHVEAGVTDPIRVTLPSQLSNQLVIQDFGPGMSYETLTELYLFYGSSTKDESDDQTGGFGIGSKSAFAYTHEFFVVSVHNGLEITARLYRDEVGQPEIEIVDTRTTDARSGTTISIPTARYDGTEFATKAEELFKFWTPGTVLVNGKQPETHGGIKVAEGIYFEEANGYWDRQSCLVMGNVAYPIDSEDIPRSFKMIAYVPIGSCPIAPNREKLLDCEKTRKVIAECVAKFNAAVEETTRNTILNAATHAEAMTEWLRWKKHFYFDTLTYKGDSFNTHTPFTGIQFKVNASRDSVRSTDRLGISHCVEHGATFIVGYNALSLSSYNKRKVRQYLDDHSMSPRYVWLGPTKPDSIWLGDIKVIDWKDIAAIRLNPASARTLRPAQTWDYWTIIGKHVHETTFPTTNLFYVSPTDYKDVSWNRVLTYMGDDATLVLVGKNRTEKFKRDYPNAQYIVTAVRDRIKVLAANPPIEYFEVEAIGWDTRRFLDRVTPSDILDPEVRSWAEKCANHDADIDWVKAGNLARESGNYYAIPKEPQVTRYEIRGYPLININYMNDSIVYMNAQYLQKTAKAADKDN